VTGWDITPEKAELPVVIYSFLYTAHAQFIAAR
jgi:hypothetical protein